MSATETKKEEKKNTIPPKDAKIKKPNRHRIRRGPAQPKPKKTMKFSKKPPKEVSYVETFNLGSVLRG